MDPDDLARVAALMELTAETVRLFADPSQDGRSSRLEELSRQIEAIAAEIASIAKRR